MWFRREKNKNPVVLLVCALLFCGCARHFVPHGPIALAPNERANDGPLYIQWLGASSWIISHENGVIVVDPFFSRPSLLTVALSLTFPYLFNDFRYNPERINNILPDLPTNTRFVLIGHAHYDHIMDVAYYMKKDPPRNVRYVGSTTAKNILLGYKPDVFDFWIAENGGKTENHNIRITAFISDHAPHIFKHEFMSGTINEARSSPPTHAGDYLDGATFIYFIDFLDENKQVLWRVFVNGAASNSRSAKRLKANRAFLEFVTDHRVNIAIMCVSGWDKVHDYPNSILSLIKPDNVVLSHYDDFFQPFKYGKDPTVPGEMKFVPFANYEDFVTHLKTLKVKYNYHYKIYQPKTGQCIRFPASHEIATCEAAAPQ